MKACRVLLVALLFALSGCNTPQAGFRYDLQKNITVGQNSFVVYANQTQAQVVRLNRIRLRDTGQVALDATVAIEETTGCVVRRGSIKGDPALIKARLKCPP